MKRFLCLLLSLMLMAALALPALAETGPVVESAGTGAVSPEEDAVGAVGAGGSIYNDGLSYSTVTHHERYNNCQKFLVIDVSEFQGSINWAKVAADGIDYAIVRLGGRRSGSGSFYVDDYASYNLRQAAANGIKLGAYYFSQAITEAEAREEAANSLAILNGAKLDLPVFIDVEYVANAYGQPSGRLYNAQLSREAQTAVALAYCKAIEDAGYEAGVYAGFLTHPIDAKPISDAGYAVWHAQWNYRCTLTDWCDFWQFSNAGLVDGFGSGSEKYVDMNYWYKPVPPSGFLDVLEGHWFYEPVRYAVDEGLFAGMGDFIFAPNSAMNREMFVTVLYRLAGQPAVEGESPYSDVQDPTHWYYDPVVWADQNDLVKGVGDGKFGRGQPLSREEMVTLLYRYAAFAGLEQTVDEDADLHAFADAPETHGWAREAMLWAVDKNIISGSDSGDGILTLEPRSYSSRAQVAAVMQRLAAVPEAPEPTPTPTPTPEPEPPEDPKPNVPALSAEQAYEAAVGCIGKTLADLVTAIGEPEGDMYVTSCLVPGGLDGMLRYDRYGFHVFTLRREDGSESVSDVIKQ